MTTLPPPTRRWHPLGLPLLACLPWAWRNYTKLGAPVFIRSNFGLELRMGNNPGALATFEEMDASGGRYLHPRVNLTISFYPSVRSSFE